MTPDAVASIHSSSVISTFDAHKPDIQQKLFRANNGQGGEFLNTIRSLGFSQVAKLDEYSHFEDKLIHPTFHTRNAITAGAAGAQVAITLDTVDLDSGNRFYPRVNDEVMFPNETVGVITSIDTAIATAPVITVKIFEAADVVPAMAAGAEIIIFSGVHGEGTGQPTGAVVGVKKYTNCAQIIKETVNATGTALVDQIWFSMKDQKGNPGYFSKANIEMDYRLATKIEGALLWGKKNTNAVTDAQGNSLKTTGGLIPALRDRGQFTQVTPGNFSIPTFDTIERTLDAEWVGPYSCMMLGINLHQDVENKLFTYLQDTNISFNRKAMNDALFGSEKGESIAANVNFKSFTKSQRTFLMKRMDCFSNKNTYGAAGYGAKDMGVILPINKRKDPVNGDDVESLGIRYRGLGGYSRMSELWDIKGAGGGVYMTDVDAKNTYTRAHIGAHQRGVNQMMLISA